MGDFTVYAEHPLAYYSPFLADRGDGAMVNFVGTRKNYPCTLDEVRCLHNYHLGTFQCKRAWFIKMPASGARYPFAHAMNGFYALRGDSPLKSYLLKRAMNGIVGRLLEVRVDGSGNVLEYGDRFNPVYHALITTPTRLRVFEFLASNWLEKEELVHVGVDGVRTTRSISTFHVNIPMGSWRFAGTESAFVLSPGAIVSTERNFKKTGYAELLAQCQGHPRARVLGADRSDPIDLGRLFLTQTRGFLDMPEKASDLLNRSFLSVPPLLGD
jgi:hypothetical protein